MKRLTREEIALVPKRILEALGLRPLRSAGALAEELGVGDNTVRNRLRDLQEEGLVCYVQAVGMRQCDRVALWKLGTQEPGEAPVHQLPVSDLRQVTIKSYPVENRRDPLVAALFGPARTVARCVCCHVEQGRGHMADCMFAQVAA